MRQIHVGGAAIFDDQQRCLVTQRSATMSNPLKWEFPGGKVESGESPEDALAREIDEELGLTIEVGAFIAQGRAQVREGLEVVLDVYRARMIRGQIQLAEHAQYQWVEVRDFGALDWAEADWPIVDALTAL